MQMRRGTYYGHHIRVREVAGLLLVEKKHPGGDRTPPHAHAQPVVCFLVDGSRHVGFGGEIHNCTPRTIVSYPPGEIHWDQFAPAGGRAFVIEFDPVWRERLGRIASVLDEPHVRTGGAFATTAMRIYDESQRQDDASDLVIEGLILELLGSLSRGHLGRTVQSTPAWLRTTADLLHAEFRTPPGLRELASRVGIHPVHLSRVFRARHGCTIGEFVRRIRIEHASRELMTSKRTLAEIAYDAGFTDQSHFTKAFRRVTHTTPARFRTQVIGRPADRAGPRRANQ